MDDAAWRDGGVYLITGRKREGSVRHLPRRSRVAQGRSGRSGRPLKELDEEKRARLLLWQLEGLGARVAYHRVDVADGAASEVADRFAAGELWLRELGSSMRRV